MLLCRRILHTSNSAATQRLIKGHVRDRTSLNFRSSHSNLVTRENFPEVGVQPFAIRPDDPPPDPRPALLETVLRVSRYSVPKTAIDPKLVAKQLMSEKTKHGPFDAYAELRAQDPTLSASLPTDVLCRLAEGAVKHGSQDIVASLTADVLDDHLLHEQQRAEVAVSLLCVPRRYSSLLDKQTTLSLLTIIRRQDQLFVLPAPASLHVMKTITDDTTSDMLDQPLMSFVLCPFLKHLASLQPPMGAKAVSYRPPETISLAYALIDKFVSHQRHHEAFELFQTLSDRGHIPAEAILADIPPPLAHDFAVIVRSTLARACLHWDWHHRGVGFIASITKSQNCLKQDLEPLALELLHASLERCSLTQFKACAWLMCHLVEPHCGITIPTKTIHLFYSRALRVGDCESAHVFYSHTQSRRVKMLKGYPSPQGATLTWLMAYLVGQKHDVHLARSLAKQVVDTSEPIPRYDRGRFIALAASQGFATEARALWERYSIGYGHEFVVGNAATMLRVVSLFTRRDSWTRAKLEKKMIQAPRLDEKGTDYYWFARQVLGAFRESILPLEEANHFDLSALARGHFMLGEMGEGLRPLRVLIGRREIPDRHDINIALSAMARQSPRAACQIVYRMVDQGLRPDRVTFGTVLHEAIVHGDSELVTEILDRTREAGVSLSSKTMVSLIQASVAVGKGMDNERLKANVRRAWEVVRTTGEWSAVHTPNVGKCCIVACLHLEDPVMAFNFWAHLIRGKTEWGDGEQRRQRHAIGSMTEDIPAVFILSPSSSCYTIPCNALVPSFSVFFWLVMLIFTFSLSDPSLTHFISLPQAPISKLRRLQSPQDPPVHHIARYLRRLQEAAAAAAQNTQSDTRDPAPDAISPISACRSLASPTRTPVFPPLPQPAPSYLEPSLTPIQAAPSIIPPSRYPITADSFHYSPVTAIPHPSFNGSHGPTANSILSPKADTQQYASSEPYGSFSAYNWSYKHHQPLPVLPPTAIPPLSYYYRPHRLGDITHRDTISLIIALFFDFVYPLTPCVHKSSFMADLHSRREERDPLFFALVMSTVASTLVQVPKSYLPMKRSVVRKLAQTCYEASRHITIASYDPPTSMHVVVRYFDCIYHFCEGHDATQHAAFGEAAHIAVTLRMHEEASYEGLDPIECEVRRRTFWLLFGADKSMSILLGRPICLRDEDCTVHFPKELDDE
ncbi:hypothetical protein J3R82DRAFT_9728 [Butyriboletus roseoflavus]|nr:hypothetical protein J3R82DRAFT_9728 [Butyriboletus roseoflavus]